jgi:flagellar hook-basal body complex protein FliE
MAIESLTSALPTAEPALGEPRPGAPAGGFGSSLLELVASVEETNGEANRAIGAMLDGTGDVHDAMIALQRADMALQLTVQVRNKLVQAYQDIMRMPV